MDHHSTAIGNSCRKENRKKQPRYFYGLHSNLKSVTNVSLYATVSATGETIIKDTEMKQTSMWTCAQPCDSTFMGDILGCLCSNPVRLALLCPFSGRENKSKEMKYFPQDGPIHSFQNLQNLGSN